MTTNTTAVPPVEFEDTGLVLPTASAVLGGAQSDINAAFGGGLNPALNTPQGQLASSLTAIIDMCNSIFALIVNGMDPDTNDGFMQDAIARIYFLNRNPGTPTVVLCNCVGALGTVIPVGALAQDESGNQYICTVGGTIPNSGTLVCTFANIVNGPIACPAGQLNIIYQAVPGWDTISNPADGVVGSNVETAAAFRLRRSQSVALNAHGSLVSIAAAVGEVAGVIDFYATENDTDSTVNTGSTNYPLLPHSLYVAVVGGAAADVANAIWTKKDVGCNTNGNTSVVITDPTGYSPPFPTYTIKFYNALENTLPFFITVNIANSATLPSNIVTLVQTALIASFTGADGSVRVRIASLLLAAKFYPGIVAIGPEVSLLSVFIGVAASPTGTSYQIGIDQAPTLDVSDIVVNLV
jgi:hypothetical protein